MIIAHTGVTLLNKPKIHELAKELNVQSKRLMEKLNEIGIYPKSHMTTLEEDELEKLYKHIGVVKRPKEDADTSRSDSEPKTDYTDKARKSMPRIIRKTEVIIHDDISLMDNRENKERKTYVRTSESNDGLMAGFTRRRDNPITNVRKRQKQESTKQKEVKSAEKAQPDIFSDIPIQPVDDILSVKKVKIRPENKDNKAEGIIAKEQENMQREMIFDETGIQSVKKVERAAVKASKTEEAEKKAEDKDDTIASEAKAIESEKEKSKKADVKKPASAEKEISQAESIEEPQRETQKPQEKTAGKSRKREASKEIDRKQRDSGDQVQLQDESKTKGADKQQTQRQVDSKSKDGGKQSQRQVDSRTKDAGQRQGEFKPREGGYQAHRQGDRSYGGRPSFDKDARSGESRRDSRSKDSRDGDRGTGGRSKPLAIPKVTVPPGIVEEKVFTRGERRSFQNVERLKEEKKELKKDSSRVAAGSVNKGSNLRKKIDTVVGHKAKVTDMMSDDFVIDVFYNDADEAINAKRAAKRLKKSKAKEKHIPPKAVLTDITVSETLTVKELAEALKKTAAEVIKKLFLMGITATQNQEIDYETAAIIGDEFGVKVHKAVVISHEDILFDDSEDKEEDLVPRAPVVVVMGHVDHGKTSLLDAIRSTNTAEQEAGGITQAIGAYTVNLHGRDITFLDTPGHEAFTAMRARGAQVTDIAILVVAADDGVMPQTVEAINHAKAAGVSIIVAINKIDKPDANPDRVKQELTEHGLLIEEWGGDVIAVPVSAKKRENIDQLLEMVLLTADILELKANPDKQAKGTVIEAKLDKNRGPVATLLVQRGTLRIGDAILSGSTFVHIRSMINDKGRKIKEAGPSIPVEIFGLSEVPEAGDLFYAVSDEKAAKQLAQKRKDEAHQKQIGRAKISLDDLFNQIQQGNVKDLNLIIKADVQGSVEAIRQSIEKLSNDEVKVNVIHGAVGAIIEADVTLADVSNAIIIGFNVRPTVQVTEMAEDMGVDIRLYRVIYDAIEDMEKAMKGLLDPVFKEVVDGHAEIRQLFKVSGVGTIGGCYVTDGKIIRNSEMRLIRNGIVVLEGKLSSLKRFKDDVKEVAAGYECGLMIERFNDIKEGDIIESFHMEEVQRQ
jgi:translation initiation factor IF-2